MTPNSADQGPADLDPETPDATPEPETPDPAPLNPAILNPATLLAGPRGRRLCLELAAVFAQKPSGTGGSTYGSATFYAAHALDPERGSSRVLFGPGTDDPPAPSTEDVAARLDAVALPELTEQDLLYALGSMVNTARYWQEPDGEDVLAASAPMRRALHRIAGHLLDSPLTQWWTAPMDPSGQWTVDFVDDPPLPPSADSSTEPKTAAFALEQWRESVVEEERRARVERPGDPTANFSGTWWSRPPGELTKSTSELPGQGPWGLQLVEDAFSWEEAEVAKLPVPTAARILELDSPNVWAQLCHDYPLEVTASKRHDWYRVTGHDREWVMPDFSLLKDKYDGVHLTMGGYLTTAGVLIPVDEQRASVLAGWDPDATYWLQDMGVASEAGMGVPDSVAEGREPARQSWAMIHDYPLWSLQDPAPDAAPRSLTAPTRSTWSWGHGDYQGWSGMAHLGAGDDVWQRASHDVLHWEVKTRSGFTVDTPGPVVAGQRVKITAHFFGFKVVEPVEVIAVVQEPDRAGFSYRTLPGHPVSGEEAFIVHRDRGGIGDEVHLTIRSLTKAAPQRPWRALFPLLLRIQKVVRKRYLRALR